MAAVPALLVALLTGWFTVLVSLQYRRNHRLSHWFWALSLAFSCVASLAYCLTLWITPHVPWLFVVYYVFGAMWMPAIMGLGSLSLHFSRRTVLVIAGIVCIVGLIGTVLMVRSPVSTRQLAQLGGGAGTGIIAQGAWLPFLIVLNAFGAAAVFFIALLSAWRTFRRQAHKRLLYGNLWLAAGILIISAAGSAARLGSPAMFWITMFIGWIVTFVGYRLLTPGPAGIVPLSRAS
ncbi:hypothetical protein JI721_09785 [Alicyclobacillus cycloheptanicus]|uniref:Preprotein translocase subunit SecG n=1 Tax=Alicyclobacillus cycloheptanicus TaxID=1457 RepID=A0ABT9XJ05_9BACL|nr:hypothetical protein [Alicyclobacillus cycloheptanicus]MDQ0190299.1 preprotein translocase subunit SecG [Alicyclobacillus cycloheptanicus]WDM00052.1 hypothetical protein JI721_09785 [Alicyclobacillus cycloheptanicus]